MEADNSRMFDGSSFTDEITSAEEAELCVSYLSHNERNFRRALIEEGLSHEEEEAKVAELWRNLLTTCKRLGYSDIIVKEKTAQFGA